MPTARQKRMNAPERSKHPKWAVIYQYGREDGLEIDFVHAPSAMDAVKRVHKKHFGDEDHIDRQFFVCLDSELHIFNSRPPKGVTITVETDDAIRQSTVL